MIYNKCDDIIIDEFNTNVLDTYLQCIFIKSVKLKSFLIVE